MTGPEPAPFGLLLRRLRTTAVLSQEALAERAGLSARAIGDLERGVHHAPRLETVRLLADALRLDAGDRAALIAAARPAVAEESTFSERDRPSSALPLPSARLIGRERELDVLCGLLKGDGHRLVTLTGPGGTGKTRLAQAVVSRVATLFPDGAWFVDLSPLDDADLVLPTIAAAIGMPDVRGGLESRLIGYFASKRVLLVLDNVERVVAAAPSVAALLAHAPGLRVLATSRTPLHVQGEQEYPVAPLPVPDTTALSTLEQLGQSEAVRLFVERAQAIQPDFALSTTNAPAVAAICQRVDGLPLAIELAAARVRVLQPAALLARLEKRLPLLTGGASTLPARQRTMRDAIAWSYDLLSPQERALFRRLAVFVGGFTLAAAEAMEDPDRGPAAFDGIVTLVEQSLLRQAAGVEDEPRYLMLETVREFGLEQLALAEEEEEARRRHANYYLRLADELVPDSFTWLRRRTYLERMTSELDNVRLAFAWCDAHGETEALLQMTSVFWVPWQASGRYREGIGFVERALKRSSPRASVARLDALNGAVKMALEHGDFARAEIHSAEERALAQDHGHPLLIGWSLGNAGLVASRRGEFGRAEALFVEARCIARDNRYVELEGWSNLWIGDMALVQAHYEHAAARYAEALAFFQETDWAWGLVDVNAGLGGVNYCTGELAGAAKHYGESLDRAWQLAVPVLAIGPLLGLAGVLAESGDAEQGARLYGAAEGIMASLGAPNFPRDDPARDRALTALTAMLGEDHLAAIRETGRMMTFEQAVAEARTVADHSRGRVRGAL
jgi:predicted ATPase/transcriptional regulator with XRE-family HTH domain